MSISSSKFLSPLEQQPVQAAYFLSEWPLFLASQEAALRSAFARAKPG
jgi:hypothetical protein